MENFQVLQNMKPEELQELLQIYRAKNEGQNINGQMHKPVMVNTMEESLLASLPNTSGRIDPMTGLRSFYEDTESPADYDPGYGPSTTPTKTTVPSWDNDGGGGGYTPPPPPEYYDSLGRAHSSQAAANAANERISAERATLETKFTDLTIDDLYDVRKADAGTYSELGDAHIRAQWDKQMTIAQKEAAAQVQDFGQEIHNIMMQRDETGRYPTMNMTWEQFSEGGGTPTGTYNRLGTTTKTNLWSLAREKAQRFEAFELTPQEIQEFAREAVQATGAVPDATRTDIAAPQMEITSDVPEVTDTTVQDYQFREGLDEALYDQRELDTIRSRSKDAYELLMDSIMGKRDSQAQQQIKRESENLMKSYLSAIAGTEAAPGKERQLKTLWAEQGQVLLRDTAELRSKEEAMARQQMLQLIELDGGREAKMALADLEARRQEAFKNADLDQVRKIGNAQMKLTGLLTERQGNLEAEKQTAIKNGELEVAVALANAQKNLTIASINAELALKSRALDDSLAIEAYKGKKEFYGLEVQIDMAEMERDLKIMGFELTRDLAEMDDATKRYVADLTGQWKAAANDTNKQGAILNMVATGVAAYAKMSSDERMKQNISSGDQEIEQFLDAIDAYQYEYRDPKAIGRDSGLLIGIMAQDAEKGGPMGNAMVSNGPRGKQLDMNQGLAAVMAAQANLHKRTKQLEGRG